MTNIFVSSTYYDLAQIRTDLSDHIKSSGHNPILSEAENFPVSPNLTTIENCIKNVKTYADVLVLIIGNRYGYVTDNGKSITNNEYLVAKQKGIPIFCFVDKKIMSTLPFWSKNKQADFSGLVENPQIYQFVDEIRNDSKNWTFEFERAQDIINIFKVQLSYLFKDSLKAWTHFNREVPDLFKYNLSDKALRIYLEREELYEFEFFGQTLIDEMEKKEFLLNDLKYNVLTPPQYFVFEMEDIVPWAKKSIATVQRIVESISNLINKASPEFFKEVGIPADLKGLFYIATKYAELFEKLVNWVISIESTAVHEDFEELKRNLSKLVLKSVYSIRDFPYEFLNQINKKKAEIMEGKEVDGIKMILQFEVEEGVEKAFSDALDSLSNK